MTEKQTRETLSPEETERKKEWLRNLSVFIVEANLQTWAADRGEVEVPARKGHKEHRYTRGDWELVDSFAGYFQAPGQTIVYYKDKPAWTMMYAGEGMSKGQEHMAKETFVFLRNALLKVNADLPFRGPEYFNDGSLHYRFKLGYGADLTNFFAHERIWKTSPEETDLFRQDFLGGLIVGKDNDRNPVYPWNL